MIKTIEDSLFYFLEEFPLNEINFEKAEEIIEKYRKGEIRAFEATHELKQNCRKEIQEWLNQNIELNKILSKHE